METSDEWLEWFRMTPTERFKASMDLWPQFIAMGGSCDPDPDYQSPFFDEAEWRALADDGRPSLRALRSSRIQS